MQIITETTTLAEETSTIPPPTTASEQPDTTAAPPQDSTELRPETPSPFTQDLVQERLLWPDNGIGFCEFEMDTSLSTPSNPLFWPKTRAYEIALPNRPCLTDDFAFVTRECKLGKNSSKPFWAKPNGTCSDKVGSTATSVLYTFNSVG